MARTGIKYSEKEAAALLQRPLGRCLRPVREMSALKPLPDFRPWNERYRSQGERVFASSGWLEFLRWLGLELGARTCQLAYEPAHLHTPAGWYKADFWIMLPSTAVRFWIEVKSTRYQGSYRDSRAKLKAAKAAYPYDRFVVAWYKKGTFEFEEIR